MDEINELIRADDLYKKGQYQKAIDVVENIIPLLITGEELAEAKRIKAWAKYYLAIKGKGDLELKTENARIAETEACAVLALSQNPKRRLSARNVLSLATWVQGRHCAAIKTSDEAVKEFTDEPSAWNTRSILMRWGKYFEASIDVCDNVASTAFVKGDYLTAGHGKHNKGDALVVLGRRKEAAKAYHEAKDSYQQHEKITRESAKPHLEAIDKKLEDLFQDWKGGATKH